MLNTVNLFIALVVAAITYGTPLLFGTLGEVLTEKSGSLNLGVEGIMFMGGAIGLGGVFYYEKAVESPSAFLAVLIGLLCAFIAGGIASLIFSFLTITLRANQNVTGLALTIFGTGVGQYIGEIMRIREGGFVAVGNDLKAVFISSPFPQAMRDIPYVGKILFGNSIFFYLGVVLAIVMHLFLNKSRTGLQLRSVGESLSLSGRHHRRRHLRCGRHGVHHHHRRLRMEPRGSVRRGLAGRGAGDLLPVASSVRHLGLRAVRRSDDPVPASDDPLHPHAAV